MSNRFRQDLKSCKRGKSDINRKIPEKMFAEPCFSKATGILNFS